MVAPIRCPAERISLLRDSYQADAAWDKKPDAEIERRFQRVKAKLLGFHPRSDHHFTEISRERSNHPCPLCPRLCLA